MSNYTLAEVAQHATSTDYWLILGDKIYAFENFVHPGGWSRHQPYAGGKADAQSAFNSRHGASNQDSYLGRYFKGYLASGEEIEESAFKGVKEALYTSVFALVAVSQF